jgi:serine/threonine protein phosphatase PrpC
MANFVVLHPTPSHSIDIQGKTNQLSKKQDHIIINNTLDNETGEPFQWCAVFDGHGSDQCIHFIRNIPIDVMNSFISSDKPVEKLAEFINKNLVLFSTSGSTICLVKIYQNRIICINCGDSQAAIYKNGEFVLITEEHTFHNSKEKNRLGNTVIYSPCYDIQMVDTNTLHSVYSEYIEWKSDCTKLACSQALGHDGVTGCAPDTVVIPITPGDTFKVVLGSDGLWDMVIKNNTADLLQLYSMDAADIMKQTTERWLQNWIMMDVLNDDPTIHYAKYTPRQCDDIAVIVADIIPI